MPKMKMIEPPQANGETTEEIYNEIATYLRSLKVKSKVPDSLIKLYAQSVSRWKECEKKIDELGLLAPHPTTGEMMASPYVKISWEYAHQARDSWRKISDIITFNIPKPKPKEEKKEEEPSNSLMEMLRQRREA